MVYMLLRFLSVTSGFLKNLSFILGLTGGCVGGLKSSLVILWVDNNSVMLMTQVQCYVLLPNFVSYFCNLLSPYKIKKNFLVFFNQSRSEFSVISYLSFIFSILITFRNAVQFWARITASTDDLKVVAVHFLFRGKI